MKFLRVILIMVMLLSVACLISCNFKYKKPVDNAARNAIIKEVEDMKGQLPMNIHGTDFTIQSIEIDGNEFVYVVSLPETIWEQQGLSQADANSDRNIARVLANFSDETLEKLVEANLGFKYVYKNERNDSTFMELIVSADKISDVHRRVKDGTLKSFTMSEIAEKEISKMKMPMQIDEGIWLTDAYIKYGNVYYEAMIEAELDASDFDVKSLAEMKTDIIKGLKEERMFMMNKKQILKDNTHFIYVYKDNRGKEIAKIDISPSDIFR